MGRLIQSARLINDKSLAEYIETHDAVYKIPVTFFWDADNNVLLAALCEDWRQYLLEKSDIAPGASMRTSSSYSSERLFSILQTQEVSKNA